MIPSTPTTTAAPQLPTVVNAENDTLIKRGRVKTPKDLTSCHQTLFQEDWESSRKRALVQAQADGAPPYSPESERLLGNHGRANINWNQLADSLEEAERPYNNLLEALDTFGSLPTKYDKADEETRQTYELIMAEEMTRMIKNWSGFFPGWQQNARLFVMDGLSFCFWDDQIDWRWRIYGMQNLKFPRRTQADVNNLDIVTCEYEAYPHDLYNKIQAEQELPEDQRYWDRDAVIGAIKAAGPEGLDTNNWEEVQRVWKDNDLTYGVTANVVKLVHGWVRELDGTVTHLICRYDGEGGFLYKCEGKYKQMSDLLVAYPYGVGTNGDFHSIRGLGYKLFSAAAGQNKLRNKFLDMACHVATPHLTSESEDAITDRSIQPMGPYMIVDNKAQFTEMKVAPFADTLIPALDELGRVFQSKAGAYAPVASGGMNRTQKTKYQVQTETEQSSTLASSGFALFMAAWQRHFKAVVRRVINPEYQTTDPGGQEVHSFRLRCLKRGVPKEAIDLIDVEAIEINTGVGKGSIGERRVVLDTLNTMLYPRLDEKGRQVLDRATAAAYAGITFARQLIPDTPGLRPPVDAQMAQLENSVMAMGQPPAFEPNQDHVVHVEKHLEFTYTIQTRLEEMEIELRPAIDQMQPVWEHAIKDHMPLISPENPDYARFKEALQQQGELITNSRKHLDAEAAREQEAQQQQATGGEAPADGGEPAGYGPDGGMPAGLLRSAVDANTRAALKDQVVIERERQRIDQEREKHRQEMAAKDVTLALEVRSKLAKAKQMTAKPAKKTPASK